MARRRHVNLPHGLAILRLQLSPVKARMVDTGSAATQPLHTPNF
jgi:hypothetical protein